GGETTSSNRLKVTSALARAKANHMSVDVCGSACPRMAELAEHLDNRYFVGDHKAGKGKYLVIAYEASIRVI
ncbi:MAG TPA: hypothetical protein VN446_03765, partial [Candidatus Acidoferrum sp.]|nr:hypothetical protein [Candidatus Acidoferrum sp.]